MPLVPPVSIRYQSYITFLSFFVQLNWIQYPWKVFSEQPDSIGKYEVPGGGFDSR